MRYRHQMLQKCLEKKTTLENKEWLVLNAKIE